MAIRRTQRDLEILKTLFTTRYLTTPQLQALFWQGADGGGLGSLKACQRRLRLLTQHGLVRRIDQQIKRGEGLKPYIYALDRQGALILVEELGIDPSDIDWRKKPAEENHPFLEHLLATTDIRIALTLACRTRSAVDLKTWIDEKELKAEAKDHVTITGPAGGKLKVAIIPDAFFILQVGGKRGYFFLEVDRRTTTVAPTRWERRSWTRKMRAYVKYLLSEEIERRYGTRALRVLTVTTGQRRLERLRAAAERAGGRTQFWFSTFDLLNPSTILTTPVWQKAGADGTFSLLD